MARRSHRLDALLRCRSFAACCLLIAAVTVGLYAGTTDHAFLASWDDGAYLIDNSLLHEPGGLSEIWSRVELPRTFPNYPLVFTSFWVEAQLFDLDPRVVHLNNVLLHALAGVLCFAAAVSIGLGLRGGLVVALLFAVHPLQVESVAWATERKNVLSGVFWLAAFLCFRRFRATRRTPFYIASLALFLCALLSKTTTVTLPVSLWLADVLVDRRGAGRALAWIAPMLIVGAGFGVLTTTIEQADEIAAGVEGPVSLPLRPLLASASLSFYVQKLFFPQELMPLYPRFAISPGRLAPWLLFSAWVALASLVVAFRRRLDGRMVWGLGHFVATLSPVVGLVYFDFLSRSDVGDRFVYLACIGLFVAVVAPIETAVRRGPTLRAGLVLLIAALCLGALALRTWNQQRVWRDDTALWEHTLRGNPQSFDARVHLAGVLHRRGELDGDANALTRAIEHYERAIEIRPRAWRARNNLANALVLSGDAPAALEQFARAMEIHPDSATLHGNRAAAWLAAGRLDPAIEDYRRAVELEPDRPSRHLALGELLLGHDLTDQAVSWLVRGRETFPEHAGLALLLARAYADGGRRERARVEVGRAIELAVAAGDGRLREAGERLQRRLDEPLPPGDRR